MNGFHRGTLAIAAAFSTTGLLAAAPPAPTPANTDAVRFGALETTLSPALSADGKHIVFVSPGKDGGNLAVVTQVATGKMTIVGRATSAPYQFSYCDWSALDRLVCQMEAVQEIRGVRFPVTRMLAADADGTNVLQLGHKDSMLQLYVRQFDARIVDWLNGRDGKLLIARDNVPEFSTGRRIAKTADGLGVDLVDTRTGKATSIEKPDETTINYISDGRGQVRIKTLGLNSYDGALRAIRRHYYRKTGSSEWLLLGVDNNDDSEMTPLAIDPNIDAAYVLIPKDGRQALYRIALDGSLKKELAFASDSVDVAGTVTVGRNGRVIGASYYTDRREVEYFDKSYQSLARALAKALPDLPLINFVSASDDESIVLIRAGSDKDPGRYYVYDRSDKSLVEILQSRIALDGVTLSPMRAITYPAADGTQIPAYLTLPPGVTEARKLPAIVLPHGGPESRDVWGFNWLAQYFAHRGFAVLQPNFRGSAGYGEDWATSGFKNWQLAVGDVRDAGRWLVSQGLADPERLATVGWSYGGYAALQTTALDADLFKAVVAIAPVTDLAQLKEDSLEYTSAIRVRDYIGSGPHVREGSPTTHAGAFKAPVLLFHGEKDFNVKLRQSQMMDYALRKAGKSSELVVYPGLEHSLEDSHARADMLDKADAFLRQHLKL